MTLYVRGVVVRMAAMIAISDGVTGRVGTELVQNNAQQVAIKLQHCNGLQTAGLLLQDVLY